MKATIKADGTLVIKVETELESYSLRRWTDENWNSCSKVLTTEDIELDWGLTIDTNDNGKT